MSCGLNVFNESFSNTELGNISYEQIFNAFDNFVQEELGRGFTKVSETSFQVLGTKSALHHQTVIDLNNKLKLQVLKNVKDNIYQYDDQILATLLKNSFEIVQEYTNNIEADGFNDLSFEPSFKHTSTQELPSAVIKKQIAFLEHYKSVLQQNKKELEAQLTHSRFHGNDATQQKTYTNQFRKEKIKIERDIQQIDAILKGDKNQKSIKDFIKYLQDPVNHNTESLFIMIEQHLDRLETLLTPTKITILQNRNEAKEILDFYQNILNLYADANNVLFSQEERKLLEPETLKIFNEYVNQIKDLSEKLYIFEIGTIQKALQDSPVVDAKTILNVGYGFASDFKNYQRLKTTAARLTPEQQVFISEFERHYKNILELKSDYTQEQLELAQLKTLYNRMFLGENEDISFFTYLILDIGSSFENNGMIPQLMLSEITRVSDHYSMVLAGETEKLENLKKEADKTLKKLGLTSRFFKELDNRTKKLTGKLISRFSSEYTSKTEYYKEATNRHYKTAEIEKRVKAEASEWHNNNSIIVNLQSIPELRDIFSNPNNPAFNLIPSAMFKIDVNHVDLLKKQLGQEGYDNLVRETVKSVEDFFTKRQALILNLILKYSPGATLQDLLTGYPEAAATLKNFDLGDPMIQHSLFNQGMDVEYKNLHTIPKLTEDYSTAFKTVESTPELKAYYDQLVNILQQIYTSKPYELQKTSHPLEVGTWEKSFSENVSDFWKDVVQNPSTFFSLKTLLVFSSPFRKMFEKTIVNNMFKHNADKKTFTRDFVTKAKKKDLNPNTYFKNPKSEIFKDFKVLAIEIATLLRQDGKALGNKSITKNTLVEKKLIPQSILKILDEYGDYSLYLKTIEVENATTGEVETQEFLEIGNFLMDYVVNQHAETQTDNLNMAISYHYAQAMSYKSLKEVAPIINLLEKHYFHQQIPGIGTRANSNKKEFARYLNWKQRVLFEDFSKIDIAEEAIEKMDNFFNLRNKYITGSYRFISEILEKTQIKNQTETIYEKKRTYKTPQEKARLKKLKNIKGSTEKLLTKAEREELTKLFLETGSNFSFNTLGEKALLKFSRFVGLGLNYFSAMANRSAAITVGMKYDSTGIFWKPGNFAKEQWTLRAASARFWTQGIISKVPFTDYAKPLKDAKIARILVDRWQILQDVRNELQQTEQRKMAQSHFGMVLNPYDHIQRVEYMNQIGMVLAMMRDVEITGVNGEKTSLREAFNGDGKLKKEFRTPHNIKNWEQSSFELSGDVKQDMKEREDFLRFKLKTIECLKTLHGDYTKHGGNVLKSTILGNMFLMFKGWSQRNFHQRLHKRSFNLALNRDTEGYYASHTRTSAVMQGALTGLKYTAVGTGAILLPGLWGVVPVSLIAYKLAQAYMKKKRGKSLNLKNSLLDIKKENSNESSLFADMMIVGKMVAAQSVGIPLNFVSGHNIIDLNSIMSNNKLKQHGLDKVQAENLRMVSSSIAVQINLLALQVAVMLLLSGGSDDEEEDKSVEERLADEIAYKYMSPEQRKSIKAVKKLQELEAKDKEAAEKYAETNKLVFLAMLTDKTSVRNFLMNSLISTTNEVSMYGDPYEVAKFYMERPLSVFNTATNTIDAFQKFYNFVFNPELDRDIVNKTSKFKTSATKLLPMPAKIFITNKYAKIDEIFDHTLFESLDPKMVAKYEDRRLKGQRSLYKEELLKEGIPSSQVDSLVNATYPTQAMIRRQEEREVLKKHSENAKNIKKANSESKKSGLGGSIEGGMGGDNFDEGIDGGI